MINEKYLKKLKETYKLDDETLKEIGFIENGKKFSANTLLELAVKFKAYDIQCFLRHKKHNSLKNIKEIKNLFGGSEMYYDNLTNPNFDYKSLEIGFDAIKLYLPELTSEKINNGIEIKEYKKYVQFVEDAWSRITKIVLHIIAAGLVVRQKDETLSKEIFNLLLDDNGDLIFEFLSEIKTDDKHQINTIIKDIIENKYTWADKRKGKKMLKDWDRNRGWFQKEYFSNQLGPYFNFYKKFQDDNLNDIPSILNRILFVHKFTSIVNKNKPSELDPSGFVSTNDTRQPLTADCQLEMEVYDECYEKGSNENSNNLKKIQDRVRKLSYQIRKKNQPNLKDFKDRLNVIHRSYGLTDKVGDKGYEYLRDTIVKDINNG